MEWQMLVANENAPWDALIPPLKVEIMSLERRMDRAWQTR